MNFVVNSERDLLAPLLFSFSCVTLFVFFAYKPFENSPDEPPRGDPVALLPLVNNHDALLEFVKIRDSSTIFLPNQFTVGNTVPSAGLPLAPGMQPFAPIFYANDPWLDAYNFNVGNSTGIEQKDFATSLLRRSFSTFGQAISFLYPKVKLNFASACIYSHGERLPIMKVNLPVKFWNDHGGELWGSTELLFTFRDNALAGPPTPAKSSGNESVDDALVSYLVELESTFDLRDGYYRFVLDP